MAMGLALVATACGGDDDDAADTTETTAEGETTETTAGGGGEGDFSACQVTDTGGVDDRSFNQTVNEGLNRAGEELGFEADFLESQAASDYAPNIEAFMEQGCSLIVTVGFLLGDDTAAAAEANPDQEFAIVDFDFSDADGNDVEYDNVRELTFATDQAAFLAGYVAAAMTETGKVGMYGGMDIPTVTIFMDGFQAGVEFYNEENGTAVEALGRDSFTGDFEDQTLGRQQTEALLDQGADIIMPVAGPVGLGSIEAIRAGGGTEKLIWVDTDGCVSVPDACDLFLTSVQKKMDNAVYDTITAAAAGEFEGGLYVGTLENDGVGIAPFHEYEDAVPQEVKDRVEELMQQIIDGEIQVT